MTENNNNSIASAFESAICDVSDITPDCGGSTYNAAVVADDNAVSDTTPAGGVSSTDQNLEQLPLASAGASDDLEDDIVLQHSSTGAAARWKRPTLLLLLLALIIIAISFGVSSNNNRTAAGNTTVIQQVKKEQQPAPTPVDPPAPKPTPPPKKAVVEVVTTPVPTVGVTDGGTATVAIDETAPPTLGERIESPTWRG